MPEIYLIEAECRLPCGPGQHNGYSFRALRDEERISIEDRAFSRHLTVRLADAATVAVFPGAPKWSDETVTSYLALAEFALGLIAQSGMPTFVVAAQLTHGRCEEVTTISRASSQPSTYGRKITGEIVAQWLQVCNDVHRKAGKRLLVTAMRYGRYLRASDIADGLLDLTIALESLLDAQTEIAFRFSTCLSKVATDKGSTAARYAELLKTLYEVRSKLAHGDPSAEKALAKLTPLCGDLSRIAKRILVQYVLFLKEHSRDEWKAHLRNQLFR